MGDRKAKVRTEEIPGVMGKFDLVVQNEADQRLTEFCQENALVIADTLFQQHKRRLYTLTSPDGQYRNQINYIACKIRLIILFAAKDGEALYSQQKQDWELTVAQIMNSLYTVEVRNRFKGPDLIECLMNYGQRFVTLYRRQGSRPSPWKRNAKKKNSYLERP